MKQTRQRTALEQRTIRPGSLNYTYYHSDRHDTHTIGPVERPAVNLPRRSFKFNKTLVVALLVIGTVGVVAHFYKPGSKLDAAGGSSDKVSAQSANSLTSPSSVTVVVNKLRPLTPLNYTPTDLTTPNVPLRPNASSEEMQLRKAVSDALQTMFAAASRDGINLMLESGYRSYASQTTLYGYYTQVQGQQAADEQSARPGYSEHQTGLAADIVGTNQSCAAQPCFANLPEAQWLAANAYNYGFIVRYPAGKQSVTGYEYESWHFRYVGTRVSVDMHNKHISTLEEYYGLPAAPNYR